MKWFRDFCWTGWVSGLKTYPTFTCICGGITKYADACMVYWVTYMPWMQTWLYISIFMWKRNPYEHRGIPHGLKSTSYIITLQCCCMETTTPCTWQSDTLTNS